MRRGPNRPFTQQLFRTDKNLFLSSSQELCPFVCTGPNASLLLDSGYASEGPSKATQRPFLPKNPMGLPERAGVDPSCCFPATAAYKPGAGEVAVTRGAN